METLAKRPINPYILTPLVDDVGFFGRDSVLRFVRNTLASPYQNLVVLFGQRRIGKTSLLHQLRRGSNVPDGFRAVYFDLQGRAEHRLEQVLFGLAREIARELDLEAPSRRAFAEESFFQYHFLPLVYERMGSDRLLVLVDEFDVLSGEAVETHAAYHSFFAYLQDLLIDEQRGLAFVFVVGRRLDELPSRIKATFKSAQCKSISVLDRPAATRLIVEPARGDVRFADDAVERLLELTSGHPYFLQLLCYELFDRALRSGRDEVRSEHVSDEVLEAVMELGMGGLAWFWDEFPPAERFILSSLAHLAPEGEAATLREIGTALREHGVRLQGMELSSAPMVLSEWGIIRPVGNDAFGFRVEFLRRWILAKHSLEEAKRELERVSARAVRDYEAGRGHHHEGRLDDARLLYLRALAANPNHARAQLGLAQAHYESGDIEAATDAFEKAYRLDPESARDGLTAAHRDSGVAHEAEGRYDQARPHYQRVLDIVPDDIGGRHRLRDSWRATAGAHLASGRWEQAAEAYREALRYVPDDMVIQRAVVDLEQRHLESETLRQRRLQLERAVLETRLREEQGRRRRLEETAADALPTFLAIAAISATGVAVGLAMVGGMLNSPWVPLGVGAYLVAISGAFVWTRSRLSRAAGIEHAPPQLESNRAAVGIDTAGSSTDTERIHRASRGRIL